MSETAGVPNWRQSLQDGLTQLLKLRNQTGPTIAFKKWRQSVSEAIQGLWPEDRASRAHARSISAEMHSGFMALRSECPMNLHRPVRGIALSEDARANIARIQAIWLECRERHGKRGPFLFGAFGAADAMFAPVVYRFRTFAIEVVSEVQAYMDTMLALPAVQEWTKAGLAETLLIDRVEAI